MTHPLLSLLIVISAGLSVGFLGTDAPDHAGAEESKEQAAQPEVKEETFPYETEKVKSGPIVVTIDAEGVLVAEHVSEISLHPEAWSRWVVKRAVEHGARVSEGEVLVEIDSRPLDEAIKDLDVQLNLEDIAVAQAEEELKVLEESVPLKLSVAKRAREIAAEDLKRFLQVDRPLSERVAEFSVKGAQNYLDYEREELSQLEKMYKADDLTEETEEIILRRQRDTVEQLEFKLETAKIHRNKSFSVDLPRRERRLRDAARAAELSWRREKTSLGQVIPKKRLELEQLEVSRERKKHRLGQLRRDRALLPVRAPSDGYVYYGRSVRGKWVGASAAVTRLQRGGSLSSHEVFLSVVMPGQLTLRAQVGEEQLFYLRPGLEGTATPKSRPDTRLSVRVERVHKVPVSAGQFDIEVALVGVYGVDGVDLDGAEGLLPGMSCSLRFVPYFRRNAVRVPPESAFTDPVSPGKTFVYVREGNTPVKRPIEVGKRTAGYIEVLSGLREGEWVLLENPEA